MLPMYIPRQYDNLGSYLQPGRVLIIYGPRQVGKTTLLTRYLKESEAKYRLDTGEDITIQEVLGSRDRSKILEYARGYEIIAIDEAQRVKDIGLGLKLLVDHAPGVRVIATGSSSFELAGQVGEPLTGRKINLTLYPIAQNELARMKNPFELKGELENYLVYGCYPAVLVCDDPSEKRRLLNEIMGSYLLKDVLSLDRVKRSRALVDILRLLAFQVGSEVSLSEIASHIGRDYKTVARYLDILEKAFVIFNLRGFSRNLRKEVFKKGKYYFYDNGIRNALISNFNELKIRNDIGQLWENFLLMERIKKQSYTGIYANNYFWRTWSKQEIDLVEEREGRLFGYEFKWGGKGRKPPREWRETYENAEYEVISRDNYLAFIA